MKIRVLADFDPVAKKRAKLIAVEAEAGAAVHGHFVMGLSGKLCCAALSAGLMEPPAESATRFPI